MQVDLIMSKNYIWYHRRFFGKVNPLRLTIESLTKNVELIKITSHFENELSYSKLLEISAGFFTQHLAQAESRIPLLGDTQSNQ